jgi:hypothetical protein
LVFKNIAAIASCHTSDTKDANQKECVQPLYGGLLQPPDNFNQVRIWELLDTYKNTALNEMYVTLRVDQYNNIVPTLIVRQQPYTSKRANKFGGNISYTNFLDLPRWVIDPTMQIGQFNIGTSNAFRCNFLQVYGQLMGQRGDQQSSVYQQILDGNFVINKPDIVRSGTTVHILNSNADVEVADGRSNTSIHAWAQLLGDWQMNMHLKLSGTITVAGISAPICIGDNLEYDGIVFQIESIQHSYTCSERGEKSFSTVLALSNGVLTNGDFYYKAPKRRANINDTNLPGFTDEEVYVNSTPIISNTSGNNDSGDKA